MEEEVNLSMNIETPIFKKLKLYLQENSKFSPYVFNDVPKNLAVFPTIVFQESNNTDYAQGTTLDRTETVDNITDTIEIYSKDTVIDGIQYSKKEITNELKHLIFDFFKAWGFERTQATKAEYLNYEVDRYIIVEVCNLNSWNRKINL